MQHAALEAFLVKPSKRLHTENFSIQRRSDLLWIFGIFSRWSLLISLIASAVFIDIYHFWTLINRTKGDTTSFHSLILVGVFLIVILNIAIIEVLQFVFRWCSIPQIFLHSSQRHSFGGKVQSGCQIMLKCFQSSLQKNLNFIIR